MLGGEVNPHPIQLVVNYWERRPAQMRARLDDLIRQGVTHVSTFVPWQLVESDISHQLTRFLQMISDRKMTLSLIVTPEVAIHYPSSGLPKDVTARKDNLAQHFHGGPVSANLAPNGVGLPSYFAPEFQKRYYSYLSRIDSFFADLSRQQPDLLRGVNLVTTGGFWKYYRSPRASCQSPYAGPAGDYSGAATLAYRQRIDQFFGQREFADPTPAAANRWKTRNMEDVNRRWFYQQSEEVTRGRMHQHLRRKSSFMPVNEIELHTPEADPSLFYSQMMQQLSGGGADFTRLSQMLDESIARGAMGSEGPAAPCVHWSSLGGFHSLADSEKQFLILKSLLLVGGQGGGIFIDAGEWFSLSQSFRTRTESLARSVASRDLRVKNRAIYLAPHLWSSSGTLWEELLRKVGPGARLVSSMDLVLRERHARLVIVDPNFVFTREAVIRLTSWVRSGRVVVMPRSSLYTESARAELESVTADTKRIEIDLGMPYRLHAVGEGKLIIYDLPEGGAFKISEEMLSSWQTFLTAILSVAEVQGYCRLSDSRLTVIPLERRGGGLGLFVMNGTRRAVSGDIIFPGEVEVSDLTVALSIAGPQKGSNPSNRFSLEVPPCGIFPLAVDGIGMLEEHERGVAAELAEATAQSAIQSAAAELQDYSENAGSLWN